MRLSAFSTGHRFNYVDWNKRQVHLHGDIETITKMTIKPVHSSLRDEIVGSYLTKQQWISKVMAKSEQYLKSKAINAMSAKKYYTSGQNDEGSPITKKHLMSLILYCDFSDLSTAFSATFRLNHVFEDIESLKRRHSEFGHFARLLVETVNDFGIDGYVKSGGEQGPWYCGMNCPMNIGSYAIRLDGPCSSSDKLVVSLNFADQNGMILKLNNDTYDGKWQHFFNCSWISAFLGESERLWIAGRCPLRLVSIVMVGSAKTYKKMVRSFYLFDAMVSGVPMNTCPVEETQEDFELLSALLTMNEGDDKPVVLDSFLWNEWKLFLRNKKEIKLDLASLDYYFPLLSKLVMFNVDWNGGGKRVDGKWCDWFDTCMNERDNVLRTKWMSKCSALHTVRIDTIGNEYKFRLEALLESMQSLSHSISLIIEDGGKWIENELSVGILADFDTAGWKIDYGKDKCVIKSE